MSYLKIPKVQLAVSLFAIYLSSLTQPDFTSKFYILIISLAFTVFFDLFFTYLKARVFFIPWAALVTGLIVALTVSPNAPWYQIAAICALAISSKNFLRVDNRHIFNPAAVGLLLGGVIFNLPVAWWGASFQTIQTHFLFFLILLLPGLVSFYRMRRFGTILSFLIIYNLLSGFRNFSDPTTIFFSLVMLPEPMTSPFDIKKQAIFGAVVAISALLFSYLSAFPDALIPALLVGNLFKFFFK